MSPEQLEGKDSDARTDIFAFGAMLYEMVTGRRAFEGKSQVSLIAAIIDHDPPPISSLQPVSPPLLDHLVKTCLAKNPDKRWQSMGDVLIQLKLIAEGGAQSAAPAVSARDKRRLRCAWAGAAVLLVTTIAGVEQVYVQSFPASGTNYQISTVGGYQPRWRRDGQELFFISDAREAMAVEVRTSKDGGFQAGVPRMLFQTNPIAVQTPRNSWDVTPDGQRFLINSVSSATAAVASITVVVNWMANGQK